MKPALRKTIAASALIVLTLCAATVQAQFGYVVTNGTVTITGYAGPGGVVTIPGEINNLPVTAIGDYVFALRRNLTSVTIPDSVTSIGDSAFYSCSSLTYVTIPHSVIKIGYGAFGDCTLLTEITVDLLNPAYSSLEGVLFNKDQTLLIQSPGEKAGSYAIPNSVTSIEDWAFSGCASLTSITIPDSVTNIGLQAFSRCATLTSITIPDSVINIGEAAFFDCYSLTSATIPDSVINIGEAAFVWCTSLTNVTIPCSVINIGCRAFGGCTSLTSVTIPNSITRIRDETFQNCTSLTSITIPASVTSIEDMAFSLCTNLTGVYFQGNSPESVGSNIFDGHLGLDFFIDPATVYYLPGTTGWGPTFEDRPTAPWVLPYPVILTTAPNFGIQANGFGFRISWATNAPVVIEAVTNPASSTWVPLKTNALVNGWTDFSDPQWTSYPGRFYRTRAE